MLDDSVLKYDFLHFLDLNHRFLDYFLNLDFLYLNQWLLNNLLNLNSFDDFDWLINLYYFDYFNGDLFDYFFDFDLDIFDWIGHLSVHILYYLDWHLSIDILNYLDWHLFNLLDMLNDFDRHLFDLLDDLDFGGLNRYFYIPVDDLGLCADRSVINAD